MIDHTRNSKKVKNSQNIFALSINWQLTSSQNTIQISFFFHFHVNKLKTFHHYFFETSVYSGKCIIYADDTKTGFLCWKTVKIEKSTVHLLVADETTTTKGHWIIILVIFQPSHGFYLKSAIQHVHYNA